MEWCSLGFVATTFNPENGQQTFFETPVNVYKLHGTQYTPQLETLLPTLLNI